MKVLHVITGLEQGGAETVLQRVVTTSPSIDHTVVSMTSSGALGQRLRELGVAVHSLEMKRGRITLSGIMRLFRVVQQTAPDVVQTWMYHADFVGGVVARLAGIRALIWGVRNTSLDPRLASRKTRMIAKWCARLSGLLPTAIVANSVVASRVHIAMGYRADRFRIIPNGFDLNRYCPDLQARKRIRVNWGVSDDEPLVGMVARWDPYKDHSTLFAALRQLLDEGIEFKCVLVGTGMDANNDALAELMKRMDLRGRVILAGSREDIPAVMNGLDLHVLSSASEAFPNVVGEAMACGTPCVVTDVGDAALIVGDTGWVAPPRDQQELSNRIKEALFVLANHERSVVSLRCRTRISDNFGLERMVNAYETLWASVAENAENAGGTSFGGGRQLPTARASVVA